MSGCAFSRIEGFQSTLNRRLSRCCNSQLNTASALDLMDRLAYIAGQLNFQSIKEVRLLWWRAHTLRELGRLRESAVCALALFKAFEKHDMLRNRLPFFYIFSLIAFESGFHEEAALMYGRTFGLIERTLGYPPNPNAFSEERERNALTELLGVNRFNALVNQGRSEHLKTVVTTVNQCVEKIAPNVDSELLLRPDAVTNF